jgi:GNAT superfamily N-acetyltransferase
MTDHVQIARIQVLSPDFEALRTEAGQQGFRFMDRLVSDWTNGLNAFCQPGETFFGAFENGRLVGVGGLNRDPYLQAHATGRLRHVYVLSARRRQGIGRALVERLLTEAQGVFDQVRLRTQTEEAGAFYVSCGFRPIRDATATHALEFGAKN